MNGNHATSIVRRPGVTPLSDQALDDTRKKIARLIHRHTGYVIWVYLSTCPDGLVDLVVSSRGAPRTPSTCIDPRLVVASLRLMPVRERRRVAQVLLYLGPGNEWALDTADGWGPHLDEAIGPGLLLSDPQYQRWVEHSLRSVKK